VANPFDRAVRQMNAPARRGRGFANAYKGAQVGGLNSDWIMGPLSADQAARFDIQTLRIRARELVVNDPVASAIPALFSENIVGENGFTLQANIGTTRGHRNEGLSLKVETAFYDWADEWCTVDGQQSYVDVQTMAAENEPTDGEFLVRLVRGFDNPHGFALELLDPDQLDHTLNIPDTGRGTSIRMGVEVDRWRRPVTYWLLKQHPSERGTRDYNRIPAADIVHLYMARRPQQTRGITLLAPVILNVKMLSGGREAVLVAMRAAACNSVTYETQEGYEPPVGNDEDPANSGNIPTDLEPGAGYQLPPGIKANFNNPPFADSAFDPFEKGILRTTAASLRVSYASLSGDVTQASYGSQRAALLPEQAAWRKLQRRFDRRFLKPVYRAWVNEALLSGSLAVDSFEPKRYWEVSWHARPFEWIDPLKDAEAADTKVGMGVQTLTRIANQNGDDFKKLIDERADEIEYAKSKRVPLFINGVDVTGQIAQPAASPRGASDAADQRDRTDATPDKAARLRVVGDDA
jgi:lambda family phage portal protein